VNAWILWRCQAREEDQWISFDRFAEVVGVAFDDEEARELERALCVEWARADAARFKKAAWWALEHDLQRTPDTTVDELSDDEIMIVFDSDESRPFVAQAVDLAGVVDIDSLRGHELVDVVRGLADIVGTLNPDAGRALLESTKERR